jgi:hypothetical protein
MAREQTSKDEYYTILGSDGKFRLTGPEGTAGSVKREYEDSAGVKGVKNELVFDKLSGKITNVAFHDGKFGKSLQITLTDEVGPMVISLNTATNFGEDAMKKLPNIDRSKVVSFNPYAFTDDKGKLRKGISIVQDGQKITNYFYDEVEKKNLHGFPTPKVKKTGKPYSKDDWKVYFIEARQFLVDYIEDNFVTDKAATIANTDDTDTLADALSALPDVE